MRERTEIAIPVLRLALRQFSDHQIAVVLEFFVSRTGKGQRASGKVVSAGEVATQFAIGLFPLPERFGRRWQAGGQTERMKQPVGRKSLQIFPIGLGRRAESSRLESHILHREMDSLATRPSRALALLVRQRCRQRSPGPQTRMQVHEERRLRRPLRRLRQIYDG